MPAYWRGTLEHEVACEFLGQVVHVYSAGAHQLRFVAGRFKFGVTLIDIGCEGNHLAVVNLLQPFEDE